MKPVFQPGRNIAMKVPSHEYESTVAFYADILGLERLGEESISSTESVRFAYGDKILWIDRVPGMSQSEIWLEVFADNIAAAASYLEEQGVSRRDDVELLPEDFPGFWIAAPGNIIHLVTGPAES